MRNEYTIDLSVLRSWVKESRFKGIRLALFIAWCVLMLGSLVLAGVAAIYDKPMNVIVHLAVAVICFYQAFIKNAVIVKAQYKRCVQMYGKRSWLRIVSFEDGGIVIKEENSEIRYKYSQIKKIAEDEEKIFLTLHTKAVIRLYKSKFVDGSWEECREKIMQNNSDIKI